MTDERSGAVERQSRRRNGSKIIVTERRLLREIALSDGISEHHLRHVT